MDIFSNTKKFLVLLTLFSIIAGIFSSENQGWPAILGAAAAFFVFAVAVGLIRLAFNKLQGKDLNSKQFISTMAVAWVIIILAQIIVKLNN